jgi:Outer membrane protein beta-barrel domain
VNSRKLVLAVTMVSSLGAATVPMAASASGFYIGVDAVARSTELDDLYYVDTYSTTHARVKAGYEILDFLAVEAQVLTAGDDSDTDEFGDTYRFDTGTIVGVYAKPKTDFSRANVYGLVGLAYWDTTFTDTDPVFGGKYTDRVVTFGAGVGGDFNITRNLRFNIEGMMQIGTASYNTAYGSYDPNIYSLSLAAGLSYHF